MFVQVVNLMYQLQIHLSVHAQSLKHLTFTESAAYSFLSRWRDIAVSWGSACGWRHLVMLCTSIYPGCPVPCLPVGSVLLSGHSVYIDAASSRPPICNSSRAVAHWHLPPLRWSVGYCLCPDVQWPKAANFQRQQQISLSSWAIGADLDPNPGREIPSKVCLPLGLPSALGDHVEFPM